MIEQIKRSRNIFELQYDRSPETIYMSESAIREVESETQSVYATEKKYEPVTLFGMTVLGIPCPDNLVIVGGIKVDGI